MLKLFSECVCQQQCLKWILSIFQQFILPPQLTVVTNVLMSSSILKQSFKVAFLRYPHESLSRVMAFSHLCVSKVPDKKGRKNYVECSWLYIMISTNTKYTRICGKLAHIKFINLVDKLGKKCEQCGMTRDRTKTSVMWFYIVYVFSLYLAILLLSIQRNLCTTITKTQ